MISSLHLENFQCWEDLTVRLGEGVNAIVGPTDSGKSAVVRALRWVMRNEPSGHQFRKSGTKMTRVTVALSSGISVRRERSKKVNRYVVITGEEEVAYDNFGRDIPEPVLDALDCAPVTLCGKGIDLNCQKTMGQHEAPFMLGWSASDRAAVLDHLAGNDILREVSGDLNSEAMLAGKALARGRRELEGIEGEIADLGDLAAEEEKQTAAEARIDALGQMIESREEVLRRLAEFERLKELVEAKVETEPLPDPERMERVEALVYRLEDIGRIRKWVEEHRSRLEEIKPIELPDPARVQKIKGRLTLLDGIYAVAERICAARSEIAGTDGRISSLSAEIDRIGEEIDAVGVCPTCGQPISGSGETAV